MSPLAFAVLLLAVIKQRCITAGAPFWIEGELPVFVVRHHAPNRDACTVTVRDEYMFRATPNIYICICIYIFDLYLSVFLRSTVSVICMHQGSESNAISILCMYVWYMWQNLQ